MSRGGGAKWHGRPARDRRSRNGWPGPTYWGSARDRLASEGWTFQYNTVGELTEVTDPNGNTTTLTYTTAGLVASVTDAQSNATTFTYDGRGNHLTSTVKFTYDALGGLRK